MAPCFSAKSANDHDLSGALPWEIRASAHGAYLSANGAVSYQPGATPQVHDQKRLWSAESAIHLLLRFGNYSRMPQSLSKVIIHIIFSTKDREPWLDRDVRPRMHAYVATICREMKAEAFLVGGVGDHLHIVTALPRTVSQAALVETVKKTSSKWLKELDSKYRGFYWQRGYGAFSVSPSQVDAVLQYVTDQEEHHRTRSFQEEYRDFLTKYGIEFDERYVWD
jgi:REP element-mobilizing transposase RayT